MEPTFIALTVYFFIAINPLGNTPFIISLLKDLPVEQQKRIIVREMILGLCLAFFFLFVGKRALDAIEVETYTIALCGGTILFLIALQLIFPKPEVTGKQAVSVSILIPIATPVLYGPCTLTALMVQVGRVENTLLLCGAILSSWVLVSAVVMMAPYLNGWIGRRGLIAMEQLMGMLLTFVSIDIFLSGLQGFRETL
jgi:multiple antibiotic resistance protein